MVGLHENIKTFVNNRWLVFVASMWIQSCSGIGYMYGSISPVIKSSMGYNQRQIALVGVAKDIGDAIGFVAGSLCEVVPIWVVLFVGVAQNFFGYGLVWLTVTHTLPQLPLWLLCVCIFVGTNGETYFNTGTLVAGVQNFPQSRGPVIGILKGFSGLSGAILTQIYIMLNFPDEASIVLVVAVGPTIVILAFMFLIRPVNGHNQVRQSDNISFFALYGVCLILAAYLLAVLVLQDFVDLTQTVVTALTVGLVTLVLLPIVIPVTLVFFFPNSNNSTMEESQETERLLGGQRKRETVDHGDKGKVVLSEGDNGKKKSGPRRGEDFSLTQALVKADFLLLFFSLAIGSGCGLTIIDNLGQMCESLGYENSHIFVSMISIWNFLGRVGGGYLSEVIVRKFAYPRPVALAGVQILMICSLLYYALSLPGSIYIVSAVMGSGYGAHWVIVPSAASELFGIKSFGAFYNFLAIGTPAGSLIFSGIIASGIYDYEAKIQQPGPVPDGQPLTCYGNICYSITCAILSGLCLVAFFLSMTVVYRTKRVYAKLFGNSRT